MPTSHRRRCLLGRSLRYLILALLLGAGARPGPARAAAAAVVTSVQAGAQVGQLRAPTTVGPGTPARPPADSAPPLRVILAKITRHSGRQWVLAPAPPARRSYQPRTLPPPAALTRRARLTYYFLTR